MTSASTVADSLRKAATDFQLTNDGSDYQVVVKKCRDAAALGEFSTVVGEVPPAVQALLTQDGITCQRNVILGGTCPCDWGCSNCHLYCDRVQTILSWKK